MPVRSQPQSTIKRGSKDKKVANIIPLNTRDEAGIALGWCASLGRDRLGEGLLAFASRHQDIDIGVHEMSPTALVAALRRGELDLVVLPGADRSEFASHLLWHEPIGIALAHDHALARKDVLIEAELASVVLLITQDDRHGAAHRLLVEYVGPQATLKTSMRPAGPERLESEIAAGEGAVLFCGAWAGTHPGIVVKPVAPPHDRIAFRALWDNQAPRAVVAELISLLASTGR